MLQSKNLNQSYGINGALSSKTFLISFQECLLEASKTSESLVFQTVITPKDAQKILEKNTSNRKISIARVQGLESVLRENRWALNGDAIRFAKDGTLLDGQHRLQAVVNANIAIQTVVFLNANNGIFKTIDIGKTRNAGDIVSIAFKEAKYPAKVAAAARTYLSYENWANGGSQLSMTVDNGAKGDSIIKHSERDKNKSHVSNEAIYSFVLQNTNFIDFITVCSKLHSSERPSCIDFHVFSALKWHTDQIDFDLSEKFWNKVVRGHKNTENPRDPINMLTAYLRKTKQRGHEKLVTSTLRHFSSIAYVWNLLRNGRGGQNLPSSFEKLVLFK